MKAIFLDRDGVINRYPGDKKYVMSWRGFKFLPRVKIAIAKLTRGNFKLFLVSNQAGIGKGVYAQSTLELITKRMLDELKKSGGHIQEVYYCTHHPRLNCPCRKPKAGLISLAKRKYPINLKESFFIGDTIRDIHTAKTAGCKSILVLSGKEKLSNRENWEIQPDFIFKDLFAAANFILKNK